MYRYQGTDNVNNWICFGTTSNCSTSDDLIDKYMYRIIGVTPDGQLALIKETGVSEGSVSSFQWNNKYNLTETECGTDGSKCTWANSRIYNRLNGLCKSGNANCNGTGTGSSGQTNIFIGNSYYDYLEDDIWLKKISDHEWKYGDTKDNDAKSFNGDTIYAIESKFSDSITAKIGLQYIHDYYYAYPGGTPGNNSTAQTSWIYSYRANTTERLITMYGPARTNVHVWYVYWNGNVSDDHPGFGGRVRPVFYLTSSVKISNATGSKTDPFIITN